MDNDENGGVVYRAGRAGIAESGSCRGSSATPSNHIPVGTGNACQVDSEPSRTFYIVIRHTGESRPTQGKPVLLKRQY